MTSSSPNGEQRIVLTANPVKIGAVTVIGNYHRTVDIEGIPLDPK